MAGGKKRGRHSYGTVFRLCVYVFLFFVVLFWLVSLYFASFLGFDAALRTIALRLSTTPVTLATRTLRE